ncbi:MAG: DapH/DapD/GlmU-related protein [Pseudomonadota bacterium]
MFTEATLTLSEAAKGLSSLSVQQDCDFAYVGKVPTRLNQRIVPCRATNHIESALKADGIAGIITTQDLKDQVPENLGLAIADDPVSASLDLHEAIAARLDHLWQDFDSEIDPSATVHPSAVIASKNVRIGAHTTIEPGAVIRERSLIGPECYIGPATIIGAEALDVRQSMSPMRILKQAGGVRLGSHVQILGHTTVVRATFGGFTEINDESIIDVHIYIAHDCKIGRRVTMVSGATISGRCEIGHGTYIGPNATLRNGIHIGESARISMGSVVTQNVESKSTVTGNFAVDHDQWLRFVKSVSD